jgi:putative transposase
MMQQVGREYVQSFNYRHNRSGTLWEGRFRSSLIRSDRYLLACYRYIEMNPVRAGITRNPADYEWSSFHHNALGQASLLLTPHEVWWQLGQDKATQRRAYFRLFEARETFADDELIRVAWRKSAPLE